MSVAEGIKPRRRRQPRAERGWGWLPLLLPALILIGLLFASFGLLAYRAIVPANGLQMTVPEALEAGAIDGFFWSAMGRTVLMAVLAAALSALMALVIANALVTLNRPWLTAITSAMLFSPLIVALAVRAYGWRLILDQGVVNVPLNAIGERLRFLELSPAMIATIVVLAHALMPLTAFPMIARLREIDKLNIAPAGRDLGASGVATFWRVVAPLAAPTMLRVGGLGFGVAMGAFGIPALIGRGRVQVVSALIYQDLIQVQWTRAFLRLIALLLVTAIALAPTFWLAARLGTRARLSSGGSS